MQECQEDNPERNQKVFAERIFKIERQECPKSATYVQQKFQWDPK